MYLSNDKDTIKKYMDYFKSKKDEDMNNYPEAVYGYNFYYKMCTIFDITTLINNSADENTTVVTPYGNYNSKVIIILDRYNEDIFKFISDKFENIRDKNIREVYTTYFNKLNKPITKKSEVTLMMKCLKKELLTIKPKYIINLSKFKNEIFNINEKVEVVGISHDYLYRLASFKTIEGMTNEEVEIFKSINNTLEKIIINTNKYF